MQRGSANDDGMLHTLIDHSVASHGERIAAAEVSGASISYQQLGELSARLGAWLQAAGVRPGDRVGICLPKTIDSLIALYGILRTGAAYVPVDPTAPAERNAYVFRDCAVKAVIVSAALAAELAPLLAEATEAPRLLHVDAPGGGDGIGAALAGIEPADAERLPASAGDPAPDPDTLAYILYTSGSTGRPKGVMISHRNARAFVDWCSTVFEPVSADRFSSHAPFHFDLSILDIYVPLKHGASLLLIGEKEGKDPATLASAIEQHGITVWYSTPSILTLLVQYGDLPGRDHSRLRLVLFAGEVFPVKHLNALRALWPEPRYFNLYGPTETNVCTWYELPPEAESERREPYPIGKPCAHYQARVVDEAGTDVAGPDAEGELCMSGPGVMQGYWALAERTEAAFLDDGDRRWYRTGDVVRRNGDGDFLYVGRRDRMVKKRGYRIELGEIEACLYRHPGIQEAAVVAVRDAEDTLLVRAYLRPRGEERLSIIKLKKFCTGHLPAYMVPDTFEMLEALPRTSTDKTDYQKLTERG